jgi:hypothetical protein
MAPDALMPVTAPSPDLVEKRLEVLTVTCDKCGRYGRYLVAKLAMGGKPRSWRYKLTKDCLRRNLPEIGAPCARQPAAAGRAGRAVL